MKKNTNWTQDEDRTLLELVQKRNTHKWAKISQILAQQFRIKKTPKKCRQRFKNHLDPSISKQQWSSDELELLVKLQNELGNRWAQISRKMQGRTDNSVKNKFYSILRRAITNINSLILKLQIHNLKAIQIGFVYKLIALIDKKFKPGCLVPNELLLQAQALKASIIHYSSIVVEHYLPTQEQLTGLASKIQFINLQFKKKVVKRQARTSSARRDTATTNILSTDHSETIKKEERQNQPLSLKHSSIKILSSPLLLISPLPEKGQIKIDNLVERQIWIKGWNSDQSDMWRSCKQIDHSFPEQPY